MVTILRKAGSLSYVLWGLLHIVVGLYPVALFLGSGPGAMLSSIHGMAPIPTMSMEEPILHMAFLTAEQYFNLAAFGVMAIWIAFRLNWRGSVLGFWLNLVVLGLVDLSFIVAEIVPGYMPLQVGLWGPILYVLGAAGTGLGLYLSRRNGTPPSRRS